MDDRIPPVNAASAIPGVSPHQADKLKHLGHLQETYTPDPSSSRILWISFTVFFFLFGLLVSAIPFLPPPKNVAPATLPAILLLDLLIGIILIACVWRLRRLARETRSRILVFAEGLAYFDGDHLSSCRWDEIEGVQGVLYQARQPFASHVLIGIRGGKLIRTYWAKEHVAVGKLLFQRLSEESSGHLLPRLFAVVEAGQTVTFQATHGRLGGAVWGSFVLGISKVGLHWGKHVLAWDDTENIDCTEGLRIRDPNRWIHSWVRLEDIPIPNSLVFLRLAGLYLQQNGRRCVPTGQDK